MIERSFAELLSNARADELGRVGLLWLFTWAEYLPRIYVIIGDCAVPGFFSPVSARLVIGKLRTENWN